MRFALVNEMGQVVGIYLYLFKHRDTYKWAIGFIWKLSAFGENSFYHRGTNSKAFIAQKCYGHTAYVRVLWFKLVKNKAIK